MNTCKWCGETHAAKCPAVSAIEYQADGVTVKRVEFYAHPLSGFTTPQPDWHYQPVTPIGASPPVDWDNRTRLTITPSVGWGWPQGMTGQATHPGNYP